MIDRYLLRYFLAVVDHGNFSRAAAQENVSQPTLSVGIAKLERLLGQALFNRSNRRVELTEAGAHFAPYARRIEAEFTIAEQVVRAVPARPLFRLGMITTIPTSLITALITQLATEAPTQRMELFEGRERDLIEALSRDRIDAALTIIRLGETRFLHEVLWTEGYALALPVSHPLAARAVISPEALADNTMIVRRHCEALSEISRYFTRHGVRPFFAARTTNDDRAIAMVQAGLGVTVMPECYEAPGVVRPKLAGFDVSRDIGLLYANGIGDKRLTGSPVVAILRKSFAK